MRIRGVFDVPRILLIDHCAVAALLVFFRDPPLLQVEHHGVVLVVAAL